MLHPFYDIYVNCFYGIANGMANYPENSAQKDLPSDNCLFAIPLE